MMPRNPQDSDMSLVRRAGLMLLRCRVSDPCPCSTNSHQQSNNTARFKATHEIQATKFEVRISSFHARAILAQTPNELLANHPVAKKFN